MLYAIYDIAYLTSIIRTNSQKFHILQDVKEQR